MIKVKYKDKLYLDLLRCNVPKWVLQKCNGFELDKRVERIVIESTDNSNKNLKINVLNQLKLFKDKLNNDDFKSNWLYCISGESDPDVARCCAAMLVSRYLELKTKSPDIYTRDPYWHRITGTLNDHFRDNKDYRDKIGYPGLLVLDCYYLESSSICLNKIRDLVDGYANTPRIIIGAGSNPIDICRNYLYIKPNAVLYAADSYNVDIEVI